jgi:hypothetical protein
MAKLLKQKSKFEKFDQVEMQSQVMKEVEQQSVKQMIPLRKQKTRMIPNLMLLKM